MSLGRQLGAYVIAADLIDLPMYFDKAINAEFASWLTQIRTRTVGTNGRWPNLTRTHRNSPNNWGAFAGASRIAASIYLNDMADVEEAAHVMEAYLGNRAAYPPGQQWGPYFQPASSPDCYRCGNDSTWTAVNPLGCYKDVDGDGSSDPVGGAIAYDISRHSGAADSCVWPAPDGGAGRDYSWEALQGTYVAAELLARRGYPVYAWGVSALKRAMDFMAQGPGGIDSSIVEKDQAKYVPWLANYAFAASYPTVTPLPLGRVMGWTDWTHGGRTRYGSSGGGGCSFADAHTINGWQVENSLLSRSLSAELSLDTYRLKTAPAELDGAYQVRLRENEQEHTTLDQVQLVAVDHAPEVRAFALDDRIVLGHTVPAWRVTTASGADVTPQASGGEQFFAGQRGDTLLVQMEAPRDSRMFGGDPVDSLAGAVILAIQPMVKYVYGILPPISGVSGGLGADPTGISDATVLGSTGILVEVPDAAGGWRTVQHRYPRELWDDFLVDSLAPGPVRLVFLSRHDLRFVGKFIPAGESAVPMPLELRSARHSRLGDVRPPVLARDQQTTALTPGDTLSLEFAASAMTEGRARDWFLLSTVVYTSLAPLTRRQPTAAHLPGDLALRQNQPNPFSRVTTIGFDLPVAGPVRLEVFDLLGRRIRVLAESDYPAGYHSMEWDRRDAGGTAVRPGVYVYRLTAGSLRREHKTIVLP